MGLGIITQSGITPPAGQKASTGKSSKTIRNTKNYSIENLVLPVSISGHDEREILFLLELLLAQKNLPKINDLSRGNYDIASSLYSQVIEQEKQGAYNV